MMGGGGEASLVPQRGRARQPVDQDRRAPGRRTGMDERQRRPAADPWPHVLRSPLRDAVRPPARRLGALHRLAGRRRRAPRRARHGGGPGPGQPGRAGRARARPVLAVAPRQARFSEQENLHFAETVNAAGGEVLLDERVRRGGSPPPEALRPAPARRRGRRRGLRRRHRPVPRAATTTPSTGATRRPSRIDDRVGPRPAVARRPAGGPRPGRRRPGVDLPGAVGGPDAASTTATRAAGRWHGHGASPASPAPLPPHAASTRPPAGPTPSRCCGPIRGAPRLSLRARRRAQRGPGLPEGTAPGPSSRLRGGPVPLVSRRRRRPWRRRCRPNPDLRLIAVVPRFPDADGAVTGPAAPARPAGRRVAVVREAGGDRVAVYDLENDAG